MGRTLITTTDNKYNPFTQYELWASYDEAVCGYYSMAYLARIASVSSDLSEEEMNRAVEDACDEVCRMDLRYISPVTGEEVGYIKVREDDAIEKAS